MASISTQASTAAAVPVKYVPPTIKDEFRKVHSVYESLKPGFDWDSISSHSLMFTEIAKILIGTQLLAPEGEATYPEPSNDVISETKFLQRYAGQFWLDRGLDGISSEDKYAFDIAFKKSPEWHYFNPRDIKNPRIAAAFKARVLSAEYQNWYNAKKTHWNEIGYRSFVDELVKQNAPPPAAVAPIGAATLAAFTQMQKEIGELKQALAEERAAAREALQCAQLREGKLRSAIAAIAGQLSASNWAATYGRRAYTARCLFCTPTSKARKN